MLYMVCGGSGSGKSAWAEDLAVRLCPGEKLYLATLTDIDGEMEARIRDHRKMREGKHFHTVERGYALEELDVSGEKLVLLECMTNLLANEMYSDGAKKPSDIPAYIMEGIRHLCSQTEDLIVIGQDAFSEVPMDPEMRKYVRESGRVSQMLAGEADVVAIAGMGGETIAAILEQAPWTRKNILLLLQPMTSFPDLRQWLLYHGYTIVRETICQEGSRMYTILTVCGGQDAPMTPAELWVGRNQPQPLRGAYLSMMKGKVRRALEGQQASAHPDEAAVEQLKLVLEGICEMEKELKA